jgi:hypothetical protein
MIHDVQSQIVNQIIIAKLTRINELIRILKNLLLFLIVKNIMMEARFTKTARKLSRLKNWNLSAMMVIIAINTSPVSKMIRSFRLNIV